jgi:hypothetical protein
MLVHRMVKDIKNSKVLHKIKTKDAYTAQQLYQQFKSQHLLDDRREYDEEDLMSAYPGLSKEEAKKLFDMLQRSTDAADLSLSKDNLIDAMGSGYTPVHVQKNRQGVFIVFKSDKDGKFYIVEKRSKQLFSVATSLAMAKRIIGETEDSKSKDVDPRGFKVNDQIIKGFMVYKMDKNPALFVAKNENGQQYEGSMEEIKRKIDAYWVKQDEDVMKQKMKDAQHNVTVKKMSERSDWYGVYIDGKLYMGNIANKVNADDLAERTRLEIQKEGGLTDFLKREIGDSKTKDKKSYGGRSHRFIIKDDKLFQLKALAKKTKDEMGLKVGDKVKEAKGNRAGTIVQVVPNGYEVKWDNGEVTFSGSNLVVKDTYTKGSADRKTKDGTYFFEGSAEEWKKIIKSIFSDANISGPTSFRGGGQEYIARIGGIGGKQVGSIGEIKPGVFRGGYQKDKFTGDPLTPKGKTIMANMKKYYGKKKGEQVFYASKNKGTISGVDEKTKDSVKSFASENDWRTAVRTIGGRVEQTGEILFAYLSGNRVAGQFDKTKGNGVLETR